MKYEHLLSPLKVRNYVIKNRMESTISLPHFSQGPEKYPGEEILHHMIGRARNGAAIVTMAHVNGEMGLPPLPQFSDVSHFPQYDIYDTRCQNYMVHMTEGIHSYGAIASMAFVPAVNTFPYINEKGEKELISGSEAGVLGDWNALIPPPPTPKIDEVSGKSEDAVKTLSGERPIGDEVAVETLVKIAKSHGQQATQLKFLGFDMVTLHMSYRATLLGKMLSPIINKRTDEFGGDIYGRAKFPLMVLKEIRDAVGPNFLIEFHISGYEPEGGNTIDDVIAFIKMAEEYADIVQIRNPEGDPNHPTGFTPEKTPMLEAAAKIKASGTKMVVSCVGGFQDPDHSEAAIRDGKLDMVSMARTWISNPDYVSLLQQERGEDVIPCVRCNRCHGRGDRDTYASVCTVNPTIGLERFQNMMTTPADVKKKIAVIGGGPGGMKAAILLSDRGHEVTIYEAKAVLGGALRHTDYVNFKWPLRDYKNYLIKQVEKRNIEIKLSTRATKEMLEGKYDAVVVSVGSESVRPPIPGADGENVVFAVDALENKDLTGRKVVVIGGGEVGMETGMYLAQEGREVTVLEMRHILAADSTKIHYRAMFEDAWEHTDGLSTVVNASVKKIESDGVVYTDAEGTEHKVLADTVVLSVGMKPLVEEAFSLYGSANGFYMIGDCQRQGTVQTTNRTAYYISKQI